MYAAFSYGARMILMICSLVALEKYEVHFGVQGYDPILHTKLIHGAIHCKGEYSISAS